MILQDDFNVIWERVQPVLPLAMRDDMVISLLSALACAFATDADDAERMLEDAKETLEDQDFTKRTLQ